MKRRLDESYGFHRAVVQIAAALGLRASKAVGGALREYSYYGNMLMCETMPGPNAIAELGERIFGLLFRIRNKM